MTGRVTPKDAEVEHVSATAAAEETVWWDLGDL
jgi:hypothetical protein